MPEIKTAMSNVSRCQAGINSVLGVDLNTVIKALRQLFGNPRKFQKKLFQRVSWNYRLHVKKEAACVAYSKWVRDDGDRTLRLNYSLTPNSVVFDVGGYKGDFAEAIHDRYGCTVYVFEPARNFFEICKRRFAHNPRVKCFNFGLSDADGEFSLSEEDDGSSLVKKNTDATSEKVKTRSVVDVYHELRVVNVDLLKLNIEGGEYFVLPYLYEHNLVSNFNHIQVQFHSFIPNAVEMRDRIRIQLSETHSVTWEYPFVWESWSRNQSGH